MTTNKYVLVSVAAGLALLGAAPIASAEEGARMPRPELGAMKPELREMRASTTLKKHEDERAIPATIASISGTMLTVTAKSGETYSVDVTHAEVRGVALADLKVGDMIVIKGDISGISIVATGVLKTGKEEKMERERGEKRRILERLFGRFGSSTTTATSTPREERAQNALIRAFGKVFPFLNRQ